MARKPAFRIPKSKCREVVEPKSSFDRRSFRWVKSGKGRILIGCPVGEWMPRSKRCRVGTRAHEVVMASRGKRCPVGYRKP